MIFVLFFPTLTSTWTNFINKPRNIWSQKQHNFCCCVKFDLMGKYLESAARLEELSRIVSSAKPNIRPKGTLPRSPHRVATPRSATPIGVKVELAEKMEPLEECRTPLARVVADCAKRWFQETLKEAKAGDTAMQVLVGQMYNSGYGVSRDPQKVFSFFFYFYHSVSFRVQYINWLHTHLL